MSNGNRHRPQPGLTLIELLVVMTILTVITTMIVVAFMSYQNSYALVQRLNAARATARDAMDRMSSELRDCQPLTSNGSPIVSAGAYECVFYSAYNQPGARSDGTGAAALRKTRLFEDLSTPGDYKTLVWQRDTNNNGSFDGGDKTMVLATAVVNGAAAVSVPYVFTYGVAGGGSTHSPSDPSTILWVQVRLIVDGNLNRSPNYIDLSTTVRPRNAPAHS